MFPCMQELPKLHRNYSSGAIIWGIVHPTEESILLLNNIDMYNYTAVVCPSHFLTPFNSAFAPTSRSSMSKPFRFLESLGKRNRKNWSQIWKLFFLHLFTLFKRSFASTSQSPMSKLFIFFGFLWKSNGKKWSQIWKLLLIKSVKSPQFFLFFFYGFFTCSLRLHVFLAPLPKVQCTNFLNFRNPLGKIMERSGLRFEIFCS